MQHEKMMELSWKFIEEAGITEDEILFRKNEDFILVDNIYSVRDAYYNDLENEIKIEEEDVCGFLDRHNIK